MLTKMYSKKIIYRCCCNNLKPSIDKAENVVKPPQTPAPQGQKEKVKDMRIVGQAIVKSFAPIGVTRVMLETLIGVNLDQVNETQVDTLRDIAKGIKEGKMTVATVFGTSNPVNDLNEQFT